MTQTGSPLLEVLAGMIKNNEEYQPELNVIPAYIDHPFYRRRIGIREDQIYKYTFMVLLGLNTLKNNEEPIDDIAIYRPYPKIGDQQF